MRKLPLVTLGLFLVACTESAPEGAAPGTAPAVGGVAAAAAAAAAPAAGGAAGAAVAVAAPAAGGAAAAAPAPAAALPERRFLLVEGTVTIDGQPAAKNTPIGESAKIEAAKASRAVITLQKGGAIEVREGSRLEIGTSPRKKTSIKVLSGILWSILPGGQADYEVITNNAVAGVRGTTFFVDGNKKGETVLCVCQGEVELEAGATKPQNLAADHRHWAYTISGSGKKAKTKLIAKAEDAPNHPNAQREELRKLAQ